MRELAATIERSSVMRLLDVAEVSSTTDLWAGDRADLCERLLSGDLHRLHAAAEQLRLTAFGFAGRADQLDGAAALRGVA